MFTNPANPHECLRPEIALECIKHTLDEEFNIDTKFRCVSMADIKRDVRTHLLDECLA